MNDDPRVSDDATGLPRTAVSPSISPVGGPSGVEWAQIHIAVPTDVAVDVAACLATGGETERG